MSNPSMLNDAHPIFNALVSEHGVDPRLVEFRDPQVEKDAHQDWMSRIEAHYAVMREKDLKEMSGQYLEPSQGGWLRVNKHSSREDRMTLMQIETPVEKTKKEPEVKATERPKARPAKKAADKPAEKEVASE